MMMLLRAGIPALLVLSSAWHAPVKRYPLPTVARLGHFARGFRDEPDGQFCRRFALTEAQVRTRFRTYRELGPGEEHDHYSTYPCWMSGEILYRGHVFTFRANAAHTMWTNWPDGKDKELGGIPDGELSGE